jgi:hypothetical protein
VAGNESSGFFILCRRETKTSRDCLYESGVAASNCLVCWRLKRDVMGEEEASRAPLSMFHLGHQGEVFLDLLGTSKDFNARRDANPTRLMALRAIYSWNGGERRKKGRKHPMPASYALKMQIKRFDRAIAECKFLAKHKTMAMAMAIFLPRSASPACRRTNA